MSSHPSPIISLKLRVIQGSNTYEKVIPSSSPETTNIFPITNQTFPELLNAFNSQPLGTIFNPSIVATYAPGTFATGDVLSTPSTSVNFVPRQITPTFLVANIPDKTTADEPFSVADLVTKTGTGVVSFSSSAQSVATINSSSGLVTIAGAGVTNITFSLAASADGVYKAAAPITKTLTVTSSVLVLDGLIVLGANNVTIKYVGNPSDVPTSSARFLQANPHGTGNQWFAVVKDGMKQKITDYAKGLSGSSTPFTPEGESSPVPFNNIVTSLMTDMSSMFQNATTFNSDISEWDTSQVTNMSRMFYNYTHSANYAFNQNIGSWVTSNVTDMSLMFRGANQFNNGDSSSIDSWDVSNVTNMSGIFARAIRFNKSLNSWNTSNVTNMSSVFQNCTAFNGNVSSWNTSKVTNMALMFYFATTFNQSINTWDTSNVTNMAAMFQSASAFNQPLNLWDVSKVSGMNSMFASATAFDQDIGLWNTGAVTDMGAMFENASLFNQAIGSWNTGAVTNMAAMFQSASAFNQPLNSWDVSAVTDMNSMFNNAAAFNQNLSGWNVALTLTRPSLSRDGFADNSPLALPANSHKLPPFV